MKKFPTQPGFTLTELLITVAIAGILLTLAMPSFQRLLLKNSTSHYASDFKMALYRAQNEAISRNIQVAVQAKTTSNELWEDGWNIFVDSNANNQYDSATETLIETYAPRTSNLSLRASTGSYSTSIGFNSLGEPVQSTGTIAYAQFRVCGPDNNTDLARTLDVSYAGKIKLTEGAAQCP